MARWKIPAALLVLGLILGAAGLWAVQRMTQHEPTAVAAVALFVADMDRSLEFYKQLGLEQSELSGDKPRRRARLNLNGPVSAVTGGGLILVEADAQVHPFEMGTTYMRVVYQVRDIQAVCARMAATPLPCHDAPKAVPGGLSADLRDPDGYAVQIVQAVR